MQYLKIRVINTMPQHGKFFSANSKSCRGSDYDETNICGPNITGLNNILLMHLSLLVVKLKTSNQFIQHKRVSILKKSFLKDVKQDFFQLILTPDLFALLFFSSELVHFISFKCSLDQLI